MQKARGWNGEYPQLHSSLARANGLYLVAGTTVEEVDGLFYHISYCFGPDGRIGGKQRQTHLSREGRRLGLSRGNGLHLFDLAGMKTWLIVRTDARYPEVGRIRALLGADLIAHSGAIVAGRDSGAAGWDVGASSVEPVLGCRSAAEGNYLLPFFRWPVCGHGPMRDNSRLDRLSRLRSRRETLRCSRAGRS